MFRVSAPFVVSFNTDVFSTGEDGITGSPLFISQSGPSFFPVVVRVRALSFSQYQFHSTNYTSFIGLKAPDLSTTFPQLPDPASAGDDFNSSVQSYVIAGEGSATLIPIPSLVVDDSESEFTEGFVLFLEVREGQLDPRDEDRITVSNSLVLINIEDNDRTFITNTAPLIIVDV